MPLLYCLLKSHNIESRYSKTLTAIYRQTWIKRELDKHTLNPVLTLFADSKIQVLIFKGAALSQLVYPNPVARTMHDLDILVPVDQAKEAAALLEQNGWSALQVDWDQTLRWLHALGFAKSKKESGIDLHWHFLRTNQEPILTQRAWEHSVPFSYGDMTLQTLCMEHHLLHACDHGARFNHPKSLRWLVDAALILNQTRTAFDWDFFLAETKQARAVCSVQLTLSYLHTAFGIQIPHHLLTRIKKTRVKWIERTAFRFDMMQSPDRPKIRHRIIPELVRYAKNHGWPVRRQQRKDFHQCLQALFITPKPLIGVIPVRLRTFKGEYWRLRRFFKLLGRGAVQSFNWRSHSISRWSEKKLKGFYELEYSEAEGHHLLRWCGPEAAIYLPKANYDLDVELTLLPFRPAAEAQARFFINDVELPEKHCRKRVDSYRIKLRRPYRPEHGGCWLHWKVRPWEKAVNDGRSLGLPILTLRIQPAKKKAYLGS
ncbi:MAG: nucleotidyltransferase family protein [Verrucomicrobiales bacterium]